MTDQALGLGVDNTFRMRKCYLLDGRSFRRIYQCTCRGAIYSYVIHLPSALDLVSKDFEHKQLGAYNFSCLHVI